MEFTDFRFNILKLSENYGLLRLASIPGKMMEQVLLKDISRPVKENKEWGAGSTDWPRVRDA